MRKLFSLFVALLATTAILAQRFQVGDLYYNITSETTVEVAGYDWYDYVLTIPSEVTCPVVKNEVHPELPNPGAGKITICVQVAQPFCEGVSIVIPGTITSWESGDATANGQVIEKVDNTESWYAGTFDWNTDEQSELPRFKIAHTLTDGTWYWDYQAYNLEFVRGYAWRDYKGDDIYIGADDQVIYIRVLDWNTTSCLDDSKVETTTYQVTGIAPSAFYDCYSLTSVTIPNSVTSIGDQAFSDCSALTSITIPNSVTSIGSSAFEDCSALTSINIPEGVKTIEHNTFYDCYSLTSVTIPNSVTSIGGGAFSDCSALTSITIPNSVTSIESEAFHNTPWYNNLPDGIVYINNVLYKYKGSMPANTSIDIKDGTVSISPSAFSSCSNLTAITIPNSVTSIGYGAFSSCSALTSITIPNSVTSIGDDAFAGSGLISATIPNTVKEVGGGLFCGCKRLTSVVLYENITSLPSGGWYSDSGFFERCYSLTSITIPNSVTEIGWEAFYGCTALKSLTIPNSVTVIRNNAFESCTSLEYLSIPNSVQYIEEDEYEVYYYNGYQSIRNCPNLKTLIVPADFFAVGGDEEDYQHVKSDYFPYLPERLESLTINDGTIHRLAWDFINRNYKTLKTIDLATTTDIAIAEEAFKNCYKLENLALPSQLEYIPYMAIAECVKLQSITIPATVTEIEDRAFENCRSIKSIIFEGTAPKQGPAHYAAATGSSLWRIGSWTFYNCHQLQNLTIPEGVTEIGDAAFYGCTYLEDMVLPSTIQEIGDNGFALCAKLKKIHVKAATPPTIQAKTFFDVNRQIPVYVPDNAVEAYKDDPYWQEFDIQGESKAPSAVDNIPSAVTNTKKIMRNGQLFILRDGKTYNTMGAEIR